MMKPIVFDQMGTPTNAKVLAGAIFHLIQSDKIKTETTQIYHYSNQGVASWYDFEITIFNISGILCHVAPIESKDFFTQTERPNYSVLNKSKITTDFNLNIPYWRDSLIECIKEIQNNIYL